MNEEGSKHNRNIPGLSFKNIPIPEPYSDTYLFVNDEIEGNEFVRDIKRKTADFYARQKSKNNIIEFVFALLEYLYNRFKILLVLLSVLFDLLFESFNAKKSEYVTKMFWGRGNFLTSAIKILLISAVFILSIAYLYRKPMSISASEEIMNKEEIANSRGTDTLVMNATVNTAVPTGRIKRYTEEYIVKRGDTLASIAKEANLNVKTIMWANDIKDVNSLRLGQTLTIPPRDGVIVTIKKGDTVESLAKKYVATAADIVDHNLLESPYTLTEGAEIFVPNGSIPEVKKPVYASTVPSYRSSSSVPYSAVPVDPSVGRFLGWPVAGSSAISRGYFAGHYGIDIYPKGGQPSVVAASGGKVISAGWGNWGTSYGGFGYYVHIDHGNGYTTLYGHMAKLYVRSGDSVGKGQGIGQIGATGVAYGIHVHFELRRGFSGRINPAPYMQ